MEAHEPVAFVSLESEDEFIVSFFVTRRDDPSVGRSIILLRDRKWGHLLPESERGVNVSDEMVPGEEEWHDNFLERIRVSQAAVELKCTHFERKLDLSRIEKSDLEAMKRLLKVMNFDNRFELELA